MPKLMRQGIPFSASAISDGEFYLIRIPRKYMKVLGVVDSQAELMCTTVNRTIQISFGKFSVSIPVSVIEDFEDQPSSTAPTTEQGGGEGEGGS